MMPLTVLNIGEDSIIRKISGSADVKQHLADLGFVAGGNVKVVAKIDGNLIVNVKEARVAINEEMAMKVMV